MPDDAEDILERLCLQPVIEKTRHVVEFEGHLWEIDEFGGMNNGLIVAEVELDAENESVRVPEWVGEEVTGDPRFFNSNLVDRPYMSWS